MIIPVPLKTMIHIFHFSMIKLHPFQIHISKFFRILSIQDNFFKIIGSSYELETHISTGINASTRP